MDECLDIYHAAEHISDCGKVLYRDAADFTEWFERMRLVVLSESFAGMERVNRMAVICALLYADQWKRYWKNSP